MLNNIKWAIIWHLTPLLERMGLVVISVPYWRHLAEIEGDYWYLKHQLQRAEAALENAGISLDPAYEEVEA